MKTTRTSHSLALNLFTMLKAAYGEAEAREIFLLYGLTIPDDSGENIAA